MGISDRKRSIDVPVNINLDLNQEITPNRFLIDINLKGGSFVGRKKSGNIFAGSKLNVDGQGIYTEKNITPDLYKKLPKQTLINGGNPPTQTPTSTVTPTITPTPSTTLLTCDFTYVVGSITNTPTPTPSCYCTYIDVIVTQEDLNAAVGNTNPISNNSVSVKHGKCGGGITSTRFTVAGIYPNAICGNSGTVPLTSYFANNSQEFGSSTAINNGQCCTPPTPTPTPTFPVCGVQLYSVNYFSGTTWEYNFISAVQCGTMTISYSTDNVTWINSSGGCTSPRYFNIGNQVGTLYFRITQLCSSGGPTISNVLSYNITPTPTPTLTPTPTATPTPTQPLCNLSLAYSVSSSLVCTISSIDVFVCMNNCNLCISTVIYETDGLGGCTTTLAPDGYYSDGIYKRNWVSGVFTGPCELC